MSSNPPGPRDAGLGFLRSASTGGLLRYFAGMAARYGPVSSLRFGAQRIVLVDDAELIEGVLVSRQHEFVRDTGALVLRELVGEGLLTTDDPAHLQRRRLMQPAFHRARVAQYADAIVAETERVTATWNGEPRDIGVDMARLTLAAVGAALFGSALHDEAMRVSAALARVIERGTAFGPLLALAAPLLGPLHRMFPKRRSLLFPRERQELDAIVGPLVQRRRAVAGDDLLSLMLAARDETGGSLDDDGLRNEVVMLILAGHETTANALTWTWYLLAEHPVVEGRLHAELDAVLGGRAPVAADVPNLPYTARVFDETLRLYPPAAAFGRRPLRRTEIGGYRIPALASVFVSPYVTQRNPRYFTDPLDFVPERFETAPPKFAYFPFGGGSKTCIGEPFARLEAVLAIATIASRYMLRRTDSAPIAPRAQALLRPERSLEMRAVRR